MYSYGPAHMAVQKQDDQLEHTFSNYVRIQDVVQKTCLMNDREKWREKVRDIRTTSTTWWWWWWWLMLNWLFWNRTVLVFKLLTYAKLNCFKWNYFCLLNWIVWNRTVFHIESVLKLNWIVWNRTVTIFNCV